MSVKFGGLGYIVVPVGIDWLYTNIQEWSNLNSLKY